MGWTFLGFLTLTFGVLPALGAFNAWRRTRRGRTIVTVSAEGIRIDDRGAWWTSTTASIPASEILDVDYSSKESAFVVARHATEQKVTDMGHSSAEYSRAEARVLRWMSRLSRFVAGRGVTIKTREGMTTFGEGLSDDEVRYVVLGGPSRPARIERLSHNVVVVRLQADPQGPAKAGHYVVVEPAVDARTRRSG